jgi:hypothetical protein
MMVRELRCGYNNLDEGAMWSAAMFAGAKLRFSPP